MCSSDLNALQLNFLPNILDGGDYVFVSAGLQWVHYLVEWQRGNGTFRTPAGALRWVTGGGVALVRDGSRIAVNDKNCQTAECQAMTGQKAKLNYLVSGATGFGVELGAVRRPGLVVSGDLLMTVLFDNDGFFAAYPLPYVSAGYNW